MRILCCHFFGCEPFCGSTVFGDYIVVLAQVGIIFSPEVEESSFDEEWFLVRILELVPIDTRNIDDSIISTC